MSCPFLEKPIEEIVHILIDQGFFLTTSYTTTEVVSQIKDYIRAFNPSPEPFRELTDKFVLFKSGTDAVLVEVANGCSKFYFQFSDSTFQEFIKFFGYTL